MPILRLTSKDNALIKTVRAIISGVRKAPKELVVAEGVRMLRDITASGCRPEAVLISEDFGIDGQEKALLQSWLSQDVRIRRIPKGLLKSLSDMPAPQGAIALVRFPARKLETMQLDSLPLILYAVGVQDPGNLGTVIRTAAAAGANFLCVGENTVSVRNPKVIRASAGAFFRIPIVESVDANRFLSYCQAHSVQVYRTDVLEGIPHTQIDMTVPCAVILGNEGHGLKREEFLGFPTIRIPMAKGVESLNVAIAAGIILFEALRQRMRY